MFKKKQREERAPRRRPDVSLDRSRPAFSYHAQRQRGEDGTVRNRSRVDGSIQLSHSSLRQKLHTLVSANIWWALFTIIFIVLLLVNAFSAVDNPRVILHGTPEQRVLLSSESQYVAHAGAILKSSPAYRLKLTADTDGFNKDFIKKYPEVAAARLQMPLFGQRPEVHITPAAPVLQLTSAQNKTFIIDRTGRAVQVAGAGELSVPKVQDQSGFSIDLGSQVLSSQDVLFIQRLQQQLTTKGVEIDAYTIPSGSRQLLLRTKGKSYIIKFTFEHEVLQQAGAYIATQQKLDSMKVVPAEYIDVRVGDRAFYK